VFGLLAIIDASECPPTFNADREHVRAFLVGGFKTLRNVEGDMSSRGPLFHLSWDDFRVEILPSLTSADTVVVVDGVCSDLANDEGLLSLVKQSKSAGAHIVHVVVGGDSSSFSCKSVADASVVIGLDSTALSIAGLEGNYFLAEIACKLVLNALTTGGHIVKGKVFCSPYSFTHTFRCCAIG
jgi:N-acetylmuramic acid 6-phosphate etherase